MFIFSLKILFSLVCIVAAIHFGGRVSFDISGRTFEMSSAVFVFFSLLLFYIYGFLLFISRKIADFFAGKPAHKKGLVSLQQALSNILLKDSDQAEKSIQKAKKYLGDIPIVSWLEGQLTLMEGDLYRAKAIFYELSAREKETALGAYSICNLALKDSSDSDAINAIDSIIKLYPRAYDLIFQAIAIHIRKRNYSGARKYLAAIENTKKARIVNAIICAEEGAETNNSNFLKTAFKMAPELTTNALLYAEYLEKNGEYRQARKVLLESFKRVHTPELYYRYTSCGNDLSDADILKFARKIAESVPESWLVHFELAKKAQENGISAVAFQNFLKAYEIKPYNFIEARLKEAAKIVESVNDKAKEIIEKSDISIESKALIVPLSNLNSFSGSIQFLWRCQHCGHESKQWVPVCDECGWIGEYRYEEKEIGEISDLKKT